MTQSDKTSAKNRSQPDAAKVPNVPGAADTSEVGKGWIDPLNAKMHSAPLNKMAPSPKNKADEARKAK
jgi:hypothetical protein